MTAVLILAAAAAAQTSSPGAVRMEPLDGDFVTASRTNVRQQPSAQAPRVGRLESGAKVRVTGKVAGEPWYAVVQEDGKAGFVAAEQLRSVAPPSPATAAPVAAPADAALREQLTKIETALADLNRQMPNLKELEALSGTVKGLVEREQKRQAEAPSEATVQPKPAPADSLPLSDRLTALQDQIAEQMREQRAQFGRLGERLDSVETSVQPLVDWAKRWTSMAAPAAEEAQGWLWATYTAVRDWLLGWTPWGKPPAPPQPKSPVKV
ncbi:SH3 domain-containing protein [Azospirillum sp. sgz301742]